MSTRRAARVLPWLLLLACRGETVNGEREAAAAPRELPRASLEKLAGKRIYFGHQSVGYDIVEGLAALGEERPELRLHIVEGRTPGALSGPAFAHAPNGRNHEPLTKIRDFAETLEGAGLGAKADIAFFKFCYVDFGPGTEVEKVFAEYRSTMARLRRAFPGVQLVHVTAPLTVVQSGPKAFVKRLLGKRLWGAEANIVRERFNALMREEYAGKEPLFDLALVESTRPGGRAVTFEDGGARHRALADEYASDGEHLNALGARRAAAHLLETLAAAAE